MLLNQDQKIIGRRIDDPFDGLLRKGFIVTTDGKQLQQVFRVHPYVLSHSEHIIGMMPDRARGSLVGQPPPWDAARRADRRI